MREPGRVTTHWCIKLRVRVRSGKPDTSITECLHRHIPGTASSTSQRHTAHQHAGL